MRIAIDYTAAVNQSAGIGRFVRSLVGALGTVYSMAGAAEQASETLLPVIAAQWSLATGLAMLAWYVFAPHCLATLAAVKRETGGWRTPVLMASYLFALAYLAAFVTYRTALAFGA